MPPEAEKAEDRGDEFVPTPDAKAAPPEPKAEEPKQEAAPAKAEEPKAEEPKKDEGAPKAEDKTRDYKVPKFRLDAATARAKKAESEAETLRAELEQLKTRAAAPTPPAATAAEANAESTRDAELERIDAEFADALANQDGKRMAALMAQARKVERDYITAQLQETSTSTRDATLTEARETMRVNAVLDQLESQFPAFDENSDDYNQELNDKVLELQQAYMAAGRSQSDALIEAVNIALPAFGYSLEDAPPAVQPPPAKDSKESVRRNAQTANQQPPKLDGLGDDSDKAGQAGELPDPLNLTTDEFDALPEETKRRMRGDFA